MECTACNDHGFIYGSCPKCGAEALPPRKEIQGESYYLVSHLTPSDPRDRGLLEDYATASKEGLLKIRRTEEVINITTGIPDVALWLLTTDRYRASQELCLFA